MTNSVFRMEFHNLMFSKPGATALKDKLFALKLVFKQEMVLSDVNWSHKYTTALFLLRYFH